MQREWCMGWVEYNRLVRDVSEGDIVEKICCQNSHYMADQSAGCSTWLSYTIMRNLPLGTSKLFNTTAQPNSISLPLCNCKYVCILTRVFIAYTWIMVGSLGDANFPLSLRAASEVNSVYIHTQCIIYKFL